MSQPSKRRAIVLTVDGWGAGFLGPYGNTWLETPACNQLASQGMLFEHALVDAPCVQAFYRAVWGGGHAAFPSRRVSPSLTDVLAQSQRSSCLLTDDRAVAEHLSGQGFDHVELLSAADPVQLAPAAEHTQLARLLAVAASTLQHDRTDLLWIHSQGMHAAWDAPRDYREQFRDEHDPPTPTEVGPPVGPAGAQLDPDDVQGWVWAYAGQVALLDDLLDALLESWRQLTDPALLIVMGARGFALAEHGHWAGSLASLHSEYLQVPLLIASNAQDLANLRCQQLVQPWHVFQTLLEWFDVDHPYRKGDRSLLRLPGDELRFEGSGWAPLAAAHLGPHWALRTPAWHACISPRLPGAVPLGKGLGTDAAERCQLYLKPDDRWEVNDVADRCRDVVGRFLELQQQLGQLSADATLEDLMPLDPALLSAQE